MDRSPRRIGRALHPFLLVAATMLWSSLALAGSITVQLDKTSGPIDEPFLMTLTIEGSTKGLREIPAVEGLSIRHIGQSSNTSIVNGSMTREIRHTFEIRPQGQGKFEIPAIALEIDGKQEASLPVSFEVLPPGASSQASGNGSKKGQAVPANFGIIVDRSCDNDTPFSGQVVTCITKIMDPGRLIEFDGVTPVSGPYRRFSIEGTKRYQTYHEGKRYLVFEMKELILPTRGGPVTVQPFKLQAVIQERSRGSSFDDFFGSGSSIFSFSRNRQVEIEGNEQILQVQTPPAEGRPKSFNGLVGEFQVFTDVSTRTVNTGETVTLTITVEGLGVSDHIPPIAMGWENIGKVYADKPKYTEAVQNSSQIGSRREFKFALVPSKSGNFDLGDVDLSYFNPKSKKYEELNAPLGELKVLKVEDAPLLTTSAVGASDSAKERVESLSDDLVGLHRQANQSANHTLTLFDRIGMVGLGGTPMLFGLLLFIRQSRSTDSSARLKEQRKSSALKTALAKTNDAADVEGLLKVVQEYFSVKTDRPGVSMTTRELEQTLQEQGLSAPDGFVELCKGFSAATYGGKTSGSLAESRQKIAEMLTDIDTQWRKRG